METASKADSEKITEGRAGRENNKKQGLSGLNL